MKKIGMILALIVSVLVVTSCTSGGCSTCGNAAPAPVQHDYKCEKMKR